MTNEKQLDQAAQIAQQEQREQAIILLLSDNELYQEAQDFMHGIARQLPPTQVNGLLNVSMNSTFDELQAFVQHQRERTTWRGEDRYVIPDFYKRLEQKLKDFDKHIPLITQGRATRPIREEVQALKMALAREFIQHILAENAYMGAVNAFRDRQQGRDAHPQQGRPQGQQTNTRGDGERRDNRNVRDTRNTRDTRGGPPQRGRA